MTDGQYQELAEFVADQFERMRRHNDRRFDGLERRTTAVEVGLEALRDDVRLMSEGITTNSARLGRVEAAVGENSIRLDRLEAATKSGFDRVDGRFERVDERFEHVDRGFDHLETSVAARFDDHEERIRAVE